MGGSVEHLKKWDEIHPSYVTWRAMMTNCGLRKTPASPTAKKLYEDRGITVCPEWRDFYVYEAWIMGTGWKRKSGLFVVRKDKNRDFCPDNCIVVNRTACENLRSNVVRIKGQTIRDILGDVPEGRSTRLQRVRQRIRNYRWPVKDALVRDTTPRSMITKMNLKGTDRVDGI